MLEKYLLIVLLNCNYKPKFNSRIDFMPCVLMLSKTHVWFHAYLTKFQLKNLGVHFKTQKEMNQREDEVLQDFLLVALKVFFHAVDAMLHEQYASSRQTSNNIPYGWSDTAKILSNQYY